MPSGSISKTKKRYSSTNALFQYHNDILQNNKLSGTMHHRHLTWRDADDFFLRFQNFGLKTTQNPAWLAWTQREEIRHTKRRILSNIWLHKQDIMPSVFCSFRFSSLLIKISQNYNKKKLPPNMFVCLSVRLSVCRADRQASSLTWFVYTLKTTQLKSRQFRCHFTGLICRKKYLLAKKK